MVAIKKRRSEFFPGVVFFYLVFGPPYLEIILVRRELDYLMDVITQGAVYKAIVLEKA